LEGQPANLLLDAYFERREELKRFFAARFGSMELAEDLVQELYLKVSALDPSHVVKNPGGYLYRLSMNLMLDQVRQRKRSAARDSAWRLAHNETRGGDDVADLPQMEDALTARRRLEVLIGGLDTLPTQTQQVFRLHKFEGLTHAQTAARLGISQRSVEKHISAALKALLARMERQR
jgi:RNA polymerase sigma-70 factor (ECF subfamily)